MHATASSYVAAPVEKVWEVLADHEGMAKWAPGLKATLVRRGDFEHNGVGAQRKIQPLALPSFVEEVIEFEPNERMSYKAVAGIPLRNYVGTVELHPAGGNTEIVYTVSADNQIPGLATVLVNGLLFALKRQVRRRS